MKRCKLISTSTDYQFSIAELKFESLIHIIDQNKISKAIQLHQSALNWLGLENSIFI